MTEQPQPTDANQLLQQLIEAITEARKEIGNLKTENNALKDSNVQIQKQFLDLLSGVEEGFKNRDEIIKKLEAAPQQTSQPQQQGDMSSIISQIVDGIQKSLTGGSQASGALNEMDMEILKQAKQIQVLSLRNAFKALSKNSGLAETVAHVVVE